MIVHVKINRRKEITFKVSFSKKFKFENNIKYICT